MHVLAVDRPQPALRGHQPPHELGPEPSLPRRWGVVEEVTPHGVGVDVGPDEGVGGVEQAPHGREVAAAQLVVEEGVEGALRRSQPHRVGQDAGDGLAHQRPAVPGVELELRRDREDAQLGLADVPVVFSLAFIGLFLAFALRRLWGLVIATFDAGRGADRPRLGHVALVRPYRSWRPLVAVWWRDPTPGDHLPPPDAVYRADEEAADAMRSDSSTVLVHRAWVDTGFKPRWIAGERGVVIPHRRALLGRWHVRMLTKRAAIADLVELHRAAPSLSPISSARSGPHSGRRHRLVPMVAWRMLAIPVAITMPFLAGPGGEPVRQLR